MDETDMSCLRCCPDHISAHLAEDHQAAECLSYFLPSLPPRFALPGGEELTLEARKRRTCLPGRLYSR